MKKLVRIKILPNWREAKSGNYDYVEKMAKLQGECLLAKKSARGEFFVEGWAWEPEWLQFAKDNPCHVWVGDVITFHREGDRLYFGEVTQIDKTWIDAMGYHLDPPRVTANVLCEDKVVRSVLLETGNFFVESYWRSKSQDYEPRQSEPLPKKVLSWMERHKKIKKVRDENGCDVEQAVAAVDKGEPITWKKLEGTPTIQGEVVVGGHLSPEPPTLEYFPASNTIYVNQKVLLFNAKTEEEIEQMREILKAAKFQRKLVEVQLELKDEIFEEVAQLQRVREQLKVIPRPAPKRTKPSLRERSFNVKDRALGTLAYLAFMGTAATGIGYGVAYLINLL